MTTPKSMQGGGAGQDMFSGLQNVLGDIAKMQSYPGADVEFLTQIQQVIVGKLQSMGANTQGGQQQQQGGMPTNPAAAAQQAQAPGGPPGGAPSPMGGPAMGLSQTGNVGNMDELARVLGGGGGAQ